jgi:hypothetical protein
MSLLQTLRNDPVTAWAGLLVLGVVTGIASAYTFDIEQPRGHISGLVRLYAPGLIFGSALGLYLFIVKESKWWVAALFALSVVVSWRLALLVVIDQSWTPFWAGATGAAGMAAAAAVLFRALRSPWRLLSLVATGAVTGDLGLRITQSMDDWSGLFALWQPAVGLALGYGLFLAKSKQDTAEPAG